MVRALVTAYGRSADEVAVPRQMRIGLSASVLRKILRLGLETPVSYLVRDYTLLIFMLLVVVGRPRRLPCGPRIWPYRTELDIAATLVHRKGRSRRDKYVLLYPANPDGVLSESPAALLNRWGTRRPFSDIFFALVGEEMPFHRRGSLRFDCGFGCT
jgi:hypothetical protein